MTDLKRLAETTAKECGVLIFGHQPNSSVMPTVIKVRGDTEQDVVNEFVDLMKMHFPGIAKNNREIFWREYPEITPPNGFPAHDKDSAWYIMCELVIPMGMA